MSSWTRKREVLSWCLYDVANSSYTTIIITVAFNVIFSQMIVGPDEGSESSFSRGNLLWSIVLSISWVITALTGPMFGAMSDVSGRRKWFLGASTLVCVLGTMALYFVEPGAVLVAAVLVILTNFAFSLSENFISCRRRKFYIAAHHHKFSNRSSNYAVSPNRDHLTQSFVLSNFKIMP